MKQNGDDPRDNVFRSPTVVALCTMQVCFLSFADILCTHMLNLFARIRHCFNWNYAWRYILMSASVSLFFLLSAVSFIVQQAAVV